MTLGVCPRCATAPAGAVRYCTACGAALALDEAMAEPWFVHCPVCEAPNAASRTSCARCEADLATGAVQDGVAAAPAPLDDEAVEDAPLFTGVVVLAGLAIVGVLAMLLLARGAELLGAAGPAQAPTSEPVAVEAVTASSALPPSGEVTYEADHLLDGDTRTAWIPAADGSEPEWVELELAEPVEVGRILLWNGYQRDGRFAEHGRITQLRLHVGDERLTADVLDVEGPQAVDLPEPIHTDRLRLELVEVMTGARYRHAALSRVDVIAAPVP